MNDKDFNVLCGFRDTIDLLEVVSRRAEEERKKKEKNNLLYSDDMAFKTCQTIEGEALGLFIMQILVLYWFFF